MGFEKVSGAAYGRFMGRFAERLAPKFADLAGVRAGQRVLDVGCGPGALTAVLVERLGADAVRAIDPSPPFVAALRQRLPGVEVRQGRAEQLPYDDAGPDTGFDAALAQLVVHFMTDPVAGLGEMRRVTRPGGVVAACVWDHGSGRGPLTPFWGVVTELWPTAGGQDFDAGAREGQLIRLAQQAGLREVEQSELTVSVPYDSFEDWWTPFTAGVGPAGEWLAGLEPDRREQLRRACAERLPQGPFEVTATAWAVTGRV